MDEILLDRMQRLQRRLFDILTGFSDYDVEKVG